MEFDEERAIQSIANVKRVSNEVRQKDGQAVEALRHVLGNALIDLESMRIRDMAKYGYITRNTIELTKAVFDGIYKLQKSTVGTKHTVRQEFTFEDFNKMLDAKTVNVTPK